MDGTNILFVVMDTARAPDALPTRHPERLPNLARIAAEGVTFENAVTTGPWTLPSHASLFTGQYTSDHGAHAGTRRFDPDAAPLAERLRASGYRTAAVSSNAWVTPEFGFGAGFDDFYVRSRPFPAGEDPATVRDASGRETLDAVIDAARRGTALPTAANALYDRYLRDRYDDGARLANWRIKRWLDGEWDGDRPFFLFANYIEPHLTYDPPADCLPKGVDDGASDRVPQDPWGYLTGAVEMGDAAFETLEALYAAELRYLDARLGRLYDHLDEADLLAETAIVVVGDHGENIGDHGLMDHQYCLYETLLRVPLLVRLPAGSGGRTASDPVELRDLFPTLLELAGADAPTAPSVSDRSLLGRIEGDPDARGGPHREYTVSEYLSPRPSISTLEDRRESPSVDVSRYDRALRCLRTDRWKYVQSTDGRERLFDVAADPDETRDVIDGNRDVARELKRTLIADRGPLRRPDGGPDRREPSEETADRLADLGYI